MEGSKAAQNKGGWKGQIFTKDGSLGTRLSPGKERASVRAGPAGVEAQRQAWARGPAQPSTALMAGLAPRDGGPVGGSRITAKKPAKVVGGLEVAPGEYRVRTTGLQRPIPSHLHSCGLAGALCNPGLSCNSLLVSCLGFQPFPIYPETPPHSKVVSFSLHA